MIGQNTPEQPARTAKELWARVRPDLDSGRSETWAEYTALSEDERVAYDRMLKRLWDYPSVLRETKRESHEEGVEDGRKEERLRFAQALLEAGVPEDTILKTSKLTVEELKELREKQ